MASKIDPALAKSLMQEFRDQNKASADPLKTPDGQHLNGFFIKRETVESILKNEKVAGIHVYFAKHPDFVGKPNNVHTVLVSGSEPNTQPSAATPFVKTGDTFTDNPPCPPFCS